MISDTSSICQSCGACCSGWKVIFNKEENSVPEEMVELVHPNWPPQMVKMKFVNDRCCALEGEIGNKVNCTIYNLRPETCRVFEYESQKCFQARQRSNIT